MTLTYCRQAALALLLLAGGCDSAPRERAGESASARSQVRQTQRQPAPVVDNVAADVPAASMLPRPSRSASIEAPSPPDPSRAHPLDLPIYDEAEPVPQFPAEVTAFMVDRDGCDHFRGEEPYDEERRVYLARSIQQLCTGTDSRLAALRRRYSLQPEVMAALGGYEEHVEEPARASDQLSW